MPRAGAETETRRVWQSSMARGCFALYQTATTGAGHPSSSSTSSNGATPLLLDNPNNAPYGIPNIAPNGIPSTNGNPNTMDTDAEDGLPILTAEKLDAVRADIAYPDRMFGIFHGHND